MYNSKKIIRERKIFIKLKIKNKMEERNSDQYLWIGSKTTPTIIIVCWVYFCQFVLKGCVLEACGDVGHMGHMVLMNQIRGGVYIMHPL